MKNQIMRSFTFIKSLLTLFVINAGVGLYFIMDESVGLCMVLKCL